MEDGRAATRLKSTLRIPCARTSNNVTVPHVPFPGTCRGKIGFVSAKHFSIGQMCLISSSGRQPRQIPYGTFDAMGKAALLHVNRLTKSFVQPAFQPAQRARGIEDTIRPAALTGI